MKVMLAAIAVAFAPVFAPALAADGTNDESDDHAQLKADIARLAGKIDTLTKTVVSSVGRVTDNVGSLTTKVDDLAARGEVAAFFDTGSGLYAAGGNIAGAVVSPITGGSGIRLPVGTYEITVSSSARMLEMHDGRRFLPLSWSAWGHPPYLLRRIVSSAVATVYSFHIDPGAVVGQPRRTAPRTAPRPTTVTTRAEAITVRRL